MSGSVRLCILLGSVDGHSFALTMPSVPLDFFFRRNEVDECTTSQLTFRFHLLIFQTLIDVLLTYDVVVNP